MLNQSEIHRGYNETTSDGVVHVCSCGWRSRPCFSSAVASCEGMDHREAVMERPSEFKPAASEYPNIPIGIRHRLEYDETTVKVGQVEWQWVAIFVLGKLAVVGWGLFILAVR